MKRPATAKKVDRSWIDDVHIEHRGEDGGMNITLALEPPKRGRHELPAYGELALLAETVFRETMRADAKAFVATHADVMAWSKGDTVTTAPDRYRVSMDFYPPDCAGERMDDIEDV